MYYVNIKAYATDYIVVTLMVYDIYAKVLHSVSSCVTPYLTSLCGNIMKNLEVLTDNF